MNSYKCCSPSTHESQSILSQLAVLKLIAEENRLKLMCILKTGEHCVCELSEHVNLSQSLISHHLKDLREANLVIADKRGREVYYTLAPQGHQILNSVDQLSRKESHA